MAKDNFIHSLRNKLTIIKGNLDLVKLEDVSESSRKFAKEAKAELNDLITSLLENQKDQ